MKKLVILSNILFTIIGLISIMLALTSFMLFDAPGSEHNTYLWVVFASAIALPFTCFGSVITSFIILFKSKNEKKALWVSLIPCIVIAILVISLTLIQTVCQGNFSCHYA